MFIWSLNRQTTRSSKWRWVTEFLAPSHRAKSQNRCEGVTFPPALLDSIRQAGLWFPVFFRRVTLQRLWCKSNPSCRCFTFKSFMPSTHGGAFVVKPPQTRFIFTLGLWACFWARVWLAAHPLNPLRNVWFTRLFVCSDTWIKDGQQCLFWRSHRPQLEHSHLHGRRWNNGSCFTPRNESTLNVAALRYSIISVFLSTIQKQYSDWRVDSLHCSCKWRTHFFRRNKVQLLRHRNSIVSGGQHSAAETLLPRYL